MKLGITMQIHNNDDIKFVTELPCFLGHPVGSPENHFKNNSEYGRNGFNQQKIRIRLWYSTIIFWAFPSGTSCLNFHIKKLILNYTPATFCLIFLLKCEKTKGMEILTL